MAVYDNMAFGMKIAKADKEEIKKCITAKCAKWWLPDEIVFQDELPLGATGKILKRELKVVYKDQYTKAG